MSSDNKEYQFGYGSEYSESRFRAKVNEYAAAAGRDVIERALLLYYALQDPEMPPWAKPLVLGALGYFISMIDAIPDLTPLVGYSDDLGVLAAAIAAITPMINEEHREKARARLQELFD